MAKLLKPIAVTMFFVFIVGVFIGVMYYSFHALGLIFPGDLLGQILGLALFDLAALTWFLVFVTHCRSVMQYVFALFGFLAGLLGTLALVALEVSISLKLVEVSEIAKPLAYTFTGVLVAHLVLIYLHHGAGPELAADISMGVDKARIQDTAQKQAEKMLADNNDALAGPIAQELVRRTLQDMGIVHRGGEVIDAKAFDLAPTQPVTEEAQPPNFLSWILNGWGKGARRYQSSAMSAASGSKPQTPKQSPAQDDAGPEDGASNEPV